MSEINFQSVRFVVAAVAISVGLLSLCSCATPAGRPHSATGLATEESSPGKQVTVYEWETLRAVKSYSPNTTTLDVNLLNDGSLAGDNMLNISWESLPQEIRTNFRDPKGYIHRFAIVLHVGKDSISAMPSEILQQAIKSARSAIAAAGPEYVAVGDIYVCVWKVTPRTVPATGPLHEIR